MRRVCSAILRFLLPASLLLGCAGQQPSRAPADTPSATADPDLERVVDAAIANNQIVALYAKYDPNVRRQLLNTAEQSDKSGGMAQARRNVQRQISEIYRPYTFRYLTVASDDAVLRYTRALLAMLRVGVQRIEGFSCETSQAERIGPLAGPDLSREFIRSHEEVVITALSSPRPVADPKLYTPDINFIMEKVAARLEVKLASATPKEQCAFALGFFEEVLTYKSESSAPILKVFFSLALEQRPKPAA